MRVLTARVLLSCQAQPVPAEKEEYKLRNVSTAKQFWRLRSILFNFLRKPQDFEMKRNEPKMRVAFFPSILFETFFAPTDIERVTQKRA
jgi:hypothetical protein